jgi:hypothetical protein
LVRQRSSSVHIIMEGRYRTINDGSNAVDESLFGSGRNSRGSNKDHGRVARRTVTGPLAPQAVVISQRELDRIKGESQIKTAMDIEEDRKRLELQKQEKEKIARDRKIKMRELEKRALKLIKKSDEQIAQEAREEAVRNMAALKRDGESDVVKLLSSMATRAAAFTIRDKQLQEKEQREHVEEEYERRMDILMELDRVKDIQRREAEEAEKIYKRVEDRKVRPLCQDELFLYRVNSSVPRAHSPSATGYHGPDPGAGAAEAADARGQGARKPGDEGDDEEVRGGRRRQGGPPPSRGTDAFDRLI